MSTDLTIQLQDYLDDVAQPVTADEVIFPPISDTRRPNRRIRGGPLAAVVAAGLVFLVAVPALLLGPGEDPTGAGIIADEVISTTVGPAHFSVGFDVDGEWCARAGSATQGEIVCGGDGPAVVAFQAFTHVAVAGFVPDSVTEVSVLFGDERRRPVDLVPAADRDGFAFGLIDGSQPTSVEVEVINDQGVVTERYALSVGSIADALGWETMRIPDEVDPDHMAMVWTGTELVFWGGFAYAPDTKTWRELPRHPGRYSAAMTGVWTGTEALFCCGVSNEAWAYQPGSESWRELSSPPFHSPPAQSVWTGEQMLVVTEGAGVAAYDPNRDQWEPFGEPPTAVGPEFHTVWTGSELIVWTANEIGVVLDPETNSWRTLPDPPAATFTTHDVAFTGNELIIWGSSLSQRFDGSILRQLPAGPPRMLDLDTNEWFELPDPLGDPEPCECHLRGGHSMVWTGESLLVSTGHLSNGADADEPLLLAYHPDSDHWTFEGVSPLGWEGGALHRIVHRDRALMADERVVLRSDQKLYISPEGWRPQGPSIGEVELDTVDQ